MGFCSEGRLASTNHRFPNCDLVLQHIPCHRTPAPNNLPGFFNSFKCPAIESHNGLGSRLANQIAREHFGNKIDFQTISPLSDRGIYIRKSFPKVYAFQNTVKHLQFTAKSLGALQSRSVTDHYLSAALLPGDDAGVVGQDGADVATQIVSSALLELKR